MSLINNQGVVGVECRMALCLGKEYAVGHHTNVIWCLAGVMKSDFASHKLRVFKFLCDSLSHGDGGDAPGLGAADQPVHSPARFDAHFWNLCCFPASGFS